MLKILVADKLADEGLALLNNHPDVEVDVKTGLSEEQLVEVVRQYDGMLIRSGVKVTAKVLEQSGRLRAVVRAGVGVDNVDLSAATAAGIVVMNTPDSNTLSTAEHTVAMMLALSRNIPAADAHVHGGQWKRADYVGVQLSGKTLGLIGLGRVGRAVAERALAFGMKVIAFDPFFSGRSALDGKVLLAENLDELLGQADYLSTHAVLSDQTRNMISTNELAKMKRSAFIVNCARGGIVEEQALADALEKGIIAGAAIDVYTSEPPKGNPLLGAPRTVLTPHLGASTREAQLAVAIDAVNVLLDYLEKDEIHSAVNVTGMPAVLSERDRQYLDLVRRMGAVLAPLCSGGIERVTVTTHGKSLEHLCATLTQQGLVELLSPHFSTRLNLINVMNFAGQRGINVEHTTSMGTEDFTDNVVIRVRAKDGICEIEGTVFVDSNPRILAIGGYRMDMIPAGTMVLIFNDDKPGVIGLVGKTFGDHKVNIADMTLSRQHDRALMVLKVDEQPPQAAVDALLQQSPPIRLVKTVELPPVNTA